VRAGRGVEGIDEDLNGVGVDIRRHAGDEDAAGGKSSPGLIDALLRFSRCDLFARSRLCASTRYRKMLFRSA
jgi:hypothetical protein